MPTLPFSAVVVTFGLLGLALVGYGGLAIAPLYHVLRDEPVAVRELPSRQGPVEVTGTAAVDEGAVVAPFSGRECLASRYEVEEYRQAGKNSYWESLAEGGDGVAFLIDDGSDLVPVDPAGAELRLGAEVTRIEAGEEPPERIASFVAASEEVDPNDETLDLRVFELSVASPQRFVERRLDIGEDVYVYGTVRRPEDPPSWGSDRVDAVLGAGGGAPFVVSDSSERGTAWRLARRPLAIAAVGAAFILATAVLAVGVF